MHLMFSLFTAAAAPCTDKSCPMPHDNAVPTITAGSANPPPLDLRAPAHLRTATFALG